MSRALNGSDRGDNLVQSRRHGLIEDGGVIAFHEPGWIAISCEALLQFIVAEPGQNGGVGNFVAIEVQEGKHSAIQCRVQK